MAVYRGVDPNTPVDTVAGAATSTASTTLAVGPLTASQVGEELVMVQSAIGNTTGVAWAATSMTERSSSSANQTLTSSAVADQGLSAAGSTGTRTETISGSVTTPQLAGALIALLPVQAYFYIHDQRGTTRVIADSASNVLASYFAGPYGQNPISTGPSASVLSTNPFTFEGQYTDAESGYQYLVHRYYDPTTGQFIASDPLVDLTGQPYAYAGDDPVNGADPLGLSCGGVFSIFNHVPLGGSSCNVISGAKNAVATGLVKASNVVGAVGAGGSAAVIVGLLGLPEDAELEAGAVAFVRASNEFAAGTELLGCALDHSIRQCTGTNLGLDIATMLSPPILDIIPADIRRAAEVTGDLSTLFNWLRNHLGSGTAFALDRPC